jgi:hypothetical protein
VHSSRVVNPDLVRITHQLLADPVHTLLEEFKVLVSLNGTHFYHSLGGLCVSDGQFYSGLFGKLFPNQDPAVLDASDPDCVVSEEKKDTWLVRPVEK